MKQIKRFFKAMYHKWTHRHLNVETPLKTMTVMKIYEHPEHGRMVQFMWEHDGKTEYGAVKMADNSKLIEGQVVQIQTYKYLEKKAG